MASTSPIDPLIQDLVEWIARKPRPYAEVMDAWRTSCPRLTVWEDAVDRGFVATRSETDGITVHATAEGRNWVASRIALRAIAGSKK